MVCTTAAQAKILITGLIVLKWQAYKQVANSTEWPICRKVSMENLKALTFMIIQKELIFKMEKQLKVMKGGLVYIELRPLISGFPDLLRK